ncbi:MAG TPA: hypothetical protein VGQ93_07835, partial [Lysobacter sp.]|nr:hypothetical protein [Lysobacter sp.]
IHPPSASGPWPMTSAYHLPPPSVPFDLLASVYGVWWTLGIVANPYDRRDVLPGSLLFAAAYGVVWLTLTRVLFPLGPLEACL